MISVLGSKPRSPSRRSITLATAGLLAASGLSLTATSAMSGEFLNNIHTRSEFMRLIRA